LPFVEAVGRGNAAGGVRDAVEAALFLADEVVGAARGLEVGQLGVLGACGRLYISGTGAGGYSDGTGRGRLRAIRGGVIGLEPISPGAAGYRASCGAPARVMAVIATAGGPYRLR
jgi:hypothetical protein